MEALLEDVEVKVVQNENEYIDSEEEMSGAEVKEEIFVEEADEPEEDETSDNDDDDEQKEAEKPIEAESGTSSTSRGPKVPKEKKEKVPKDNRNYIACPKESFIAVDLSIHPQKLEPPVFNSNGSGRNSVLTFKDKSPSEITDHLLGPLIDHVVKMYKINRWRDQGAHYCQV